MLNINGVQSTPIQIFEHNYKNWTKSFLVSNKSNKCKKFNLNKNKPKIPAHILHKIKIQKQVPITFKWAVNKHKKAVVLKNKIN